MARPGVLVFATLIGALPAAPEADPESPDGVVASVVAELEAAGLDLLSDGRGAREVCGEEDIAEVVRAWHVAGSATDRPVKQALVGPFTLSRRDREGAVGAAGPPHSDTAGPVHEAIAALAAAGCPLIEIEEPAAVSIGGDERERRQFAEALRIVTADLGDTVHLCLVLTGGDADSLGAATIYDLPFSSYAFDVITGPENWRLIAQAPADRGVVVGALSPSAGADDRPEVLVWAAHYAASIGGRGLVRVGLANASGLEGLSWDRAWAKVRALAEAAGIAASSSPQELAEAIDPRAVDIRSAATGRFSSTASRRRTHP